MAIRTIFLAGLLVSFAAWNAPGRSDDPSPAQKADALKRHGLDPASPLDSRVKETSEKVLKMFKDAGMTETKTHVLNEEERKKLSAAFAALPPLHQRILKSHLRSINFLDGMPNTALTSTVNPDEPYPVFDITVRAGIFGEDVSDWYTQKERTCFKADGSPLSVSVDIGKIDAIVYVLLHEATHVVDATLGITPKFVAKPVFKKPEDPVNTTEFTKDVWLDRTTTVAKYRDPLLEGTRFRQGGAPIPITKAEAVYTAMSRTPFTSLYGSSNHYDDLAEFVALHHFTEVLKQPYRIVIRNEGKEVYAYEPMKSELVRKRFDQMKPFYEDGR